MAKQPPPKQPQKQSTSKLSSIAAALIKEPSKATNAQIKSLAASVLSQDETKGNPKKK